MEWQRIRNSKSRNQHLCSCSWAKINKDPPDERQRLVTSANATPDSLLNWIQILWVNFLSIFITPGPSFLRSCSSSICGLISKTKSFGCRSWQFQYFCVHRTCHTCIDVLVNFYIMKIICILEYQYKFGHVVYCLIENYKNIKKQGHHNNHSCILYNFYCILYRRYPKLRGSQRLWKVKIYPLKPIYFRGC